MRETATKQKNNLPKRPECQIQDWCYVRPVIAASLPSKRCGKRESRVQTGGPATVGKTTFLNRFRDHWVCDGHIHKPAAV
jgi:hypothetical protein